MMTQEIKNSFYFVIFLRELFSCYTNYTWVILVCCIYIKPNGITVFTDVEKQCSSTLIVVNIRTYIRTGTKFFCVKIIPGYDLNVRTFRTTYPTP